MVRTSFCYEQEPNPLSKLRQETLLSSQSFSHVDKSRKIEAHIDQVVNRGEGGT